MKRKEDRERRREKRERGKRGYTEVVTLVSHCGNLCVQIYAVGHRAE